MTFSRFFSNFYFFNKTSLNILTNYFFLLIGFLIGNLCGSIFSKTSVSPFLFIIVVITCFEIFSYVYYKTITFCENTQKVEPLQKIYYSSLKNLKFFYFIKIGTLFGLFVDAFKVGS